MMKLQLYGSTVQQLDKQFILKRSVISLFFFFLVSVKFRNCVFMIVVIQQGSLVGDWQLCSDNIIFYHDAGSMIKYHKNLTARGYQALIFR